MTNCGAILCWRCWVDKHDPCGGDRRWAGDQGMGLVGMSTLNRMELGAKQKGERYKKIILDDAAGGSVIGRQFLASSPASPGRDGSGCRQHRHCAAGKARSSFFPRLLTGHYCYLPLYIVCGEFVLGARPATVEPRRGPRMQHRVGTDRSSDPAAMAAGTDYRAGDASFCREEVLSWCEQHGVNYVVGLAQNARLLRQIAAERAEVEREYQQTGKAARGCLPICATGRARVGHGTAGSLPKPNTWTKGPTRASW